MVNQNVHLATGWHRPTREPIADFRGAWVAAQTAPASMLGKKEGPLRTQLPISARVVGRDDIVVGGDVGIDRLVTDLEDAPDAAADRHSPAIILIISLPVGRNEGGQWSSTSPWGGYN